MSKVLFRFMSYPMAKTVSDQAMVAAETAAGRLAVVHDWR